MANLIADYEQDYCVLTAQITADIGKLRLTTAGERNEHIAKINSNVTEAQELLEQMGLEIRDTPAASRPGLTSRLNCYQAELKRLQQEFANAKSTKNTNSLTYDSVDDFEELSITEGQKQRLLDNSERIERTGNRLEEGYRIVLETEVVGTQVLQELNEQRETITRARARLRETDSELGRSSRIMNSMIMRSLRDKAVLFGVGIVFFVVVCFSIYFSISK